MIAIAITQVIMLTIAIAYFLNRDNNPHADILSAIWTVGSMSMNGLYYIPACHCG